MTTTLVYPNGTKLYLFPNGHAQINGFLLPDGVIDADALAAAVDRRRSRQTPPDTVGSTIDKLSEVDCHPNVCTLEFYKSVNTLHQMIMRHAAEMLPGGGICIGATIFYGAAWGLSACVVFGQHSTSIIVSTVEAASLPSAGVSATQMTIADRDVDSRYCGRFDHRAGSAAFGLGGWDENQETGRVFDTYGGLQAGKSLPYVPVNVEYGYSDTHWIWNFDDSGAHQIC